MVSLGTCNHCTGLQIIIVSVYASVKCHDCMQLPNLQDLKLAATATEIKWPPPADGNTPAPLRSIMPLRFLRTLDLSVNDIAPDATRSSHIPELIKALPTAIESLWLRGETHNGGVGCNEVSVKALAGKVSTEASVGHKFGA